MVDSKENCKFGLGVKGLSEETERTVAWLYAWQQEREDDEIWKNH